MARKPVNEVTALETRAGLWAQIRSMRSFTIVQLRRETRCSVSQTAEYVKGLLAAGIIERSDSERGRYLLVNDCGTEAPRVRRDGSQVTMGRGREQMWRTMRLLKSFTAVDLAVHASTEEHPVAVKEAASYCRALAKADYLDQLATGYRFIPNRYTGPMPPMIQRDKSIYDPNLKKVVWEKGAKP